VKRSPGDCGRREAEGTGVWPFSLKKSRKLCLMSAEVMMLVLQDHKMGGISIEKAVGGMRVEI
jgi:hypothetical protein